MRDKYYSKLIHEKEIRRENEILRRKKNGYLFSKVNSNKIVKLKEEIKAPEDFRFINNPILCLKFFNDLRVKDNYSNIYGRRSLRISLSKVKFIDFATISILKSIFEEAKLSGINIQGNFPVDEICKNHLINSGFLNNLYDKNSNEITINSQGEYFSFEKKSGKVTVKDLKYFDEISFKTYFYLKGIDGYSDEIITILKEISGNAVEWSDSFNKQWMLGVYKEKNKVIFTITDLGKGIIETLFINQKLKIIDFMMIRNNLDVLSRAFERKYGSYSQEINRNRGLPSIKKSFDDNKIKNLIVCTNNVILHFKESNKSLIYKQEYLHFFGTFYQWELDVNCLN